MQAVLGNGLGQTARMTIASASPAAARNTGLATGPALTTSIGTATANPDPARAKALALTPSSVGATTDLIWHNPTTGQTVSWAMNGAATTSSTTLLQLPNWKVTRTADLNGDGQQDLIWENSSTNQIVAWLMHGSQALQSTVLLQNAGWKITHSADFNGDGKDDLLFYNASTGQTVLWLMNGTTVLSSQVLFTSPVWQVSLLADLNGDGKADLIWRNSQTGQTAAWLMNGTAVSSSATLLELASWRITQVGDLDGDGKDDLIWTNDTTGQTVLWLMNGLSSSNSTVLFTHPLWRVSRIADLDGDGKADLIWTNGASGEVAGWLMNGAAIKSNAVLLGNASWQLANVVDLNGDGKQDLIWRNAGTNQTVAWVMNGLVAASQTTLLGIPGWEVVGARVQATPTQDGGPGFALSASMSKVEPLQRIDLSFPSSASSSKGFEVEVDVSGRGAFAVTDTIKIPLTRSGATAGFFNAPLLEAFLAVRGQAVPTSFSLRLRNLSSNDFSKALVIGYDRIEVPLADRGKPSTLLQVMFAGVYKSQPGVLATRAARLRPGRQAALLATVSNAATVSDLQAEAMLRQIFGVTTIAKPLASGRAVALAFSGRQGIVPDRLKNGFNRIFACLNRAAASLFSNVETQEMAADACEEEARLAARDDIIPGFQDSQESLAGTLTTILSAAPRGVAAFAGDFVQRMAFSAEMSKAAVDFGQIVLTIPGVTAPVSESVDFYLGKVTTALKTKLYEKFTQDLGELDKKALELANAPEFVSQLLDKSLSSIQAGRELLDGVQSTHEELRQMTNIAGEFGGTSPPTQFSLGGAPGIQVQPTVDTPASVCAGNELTGEMLQSIGFNGSCVAFMTPFFDKVYFESNLRPLFDAILRIDQSALESCVANFTPACQALFDQLSAFNTRVAAAVSAYNAKQYDCDVGYKKYENRSGGLTCIYGELTYARQGSACFAGSTAPSFDAGSSPVCVYFQSDFLQSNGSCRANYSKVTINGRATCRWTSLTPNMPAAYGINKITGEKATLSP